MASSSNTTTDHKAIRKWAEDRGARPAHVKGTGGKDDPGLLRFDFGTPEESLEEISWDEFFDKFEERKLALLYQEGKESRFFKLVNRE